MGSVTPATPSPLDTQTHSPPAKPTEPVARMYAGDTRGCGHFLRRQVQEDAEVSIIHVLRRRSAA